MDIVILVIFFALAIAGLVRLEREDEENELEKPDQGFPYSRGKKRK